ANGSGRSGVRFGRDQGVYDTHTAVTDRQDIEPGSVWLAGRPDAPRHRRGVRDKVSRAVLFEDVPRQHAIEEVLSLLAQRLPADKFSVWIDERHIFRIRPPDGLPPAFRVSFGKDLVQ